MAGNLAAEGTDPAPGSGWQGAPAVSHVATIAMVSVATRFQPLVNEVLATWMPRATVLTMSRGEIAGNDEVELVVAGPMEDGSAALAELRFLRAQGYCNPLLLLTSSNAPSGKAFDVELTRLGACGCVLDDGFAARLADLAAMGGQGGDAFVEADGPTTALRKEVDETRKLLALAEIARHLPHAMNNPLSALLAEAQLMELEELAQDQREAIERIVSLARRVIGLVRELQQAQPRR